jgi:hypothetical protein
MFESAFLPEKTVISEKGESPAIDLSATSGRVFLIVLKITEIVEQESFDLMIFGSSDGQNWTPKPVVTFPQQFYISQTPMILDLSAQPEIKYVRSRWEVNRWGRGSEKPRFEVQISLKEVPAEMLPLAAHN